MKNPARSCLAPWKQLARQLSWIATVNLLDRMNAPTRQPAGLN
jgi:hypothetical protein